MYKGKKNDAHISTHLKTIDRKRNKGFITYPKAGSIAGNVAASPPPLA